MNDDTIKVLLIEDNPADVFLILELLTAQKERTFSIENSERLADGLTRISKDNVHVVLLDLLLPDSEGLQTFEKVKSSAPYVPVIIMTGTSDENIAIEAMKKGAQDYLVKGQVDSRLLTRSIYYAIERKKLEEQLRAVTITDDLTGLFNRRGFFTLSDQQRKLADRTKRKMYLLYLDLNHMKQINDKFGHKEGDQALCDTANILKRTFRQSDIIARIGGDEFVVLLTEPVEADIENIVNNHLHDNLETHNKQAGRSFQITISTGIVPYDPEYPCSIGNLLSRADDQMYEDKKRIYEIEIKAAMSEKVTERRTYKRVKINSNCHAKLDNSSDITIKDISFGGICIETSQEISPDEMQTIDLVCDNEKITLRSIPVPDSTQGTVEKSEGTADCYVVRLRFTGLSNSDIRSLESILNRFSKSL
jgi:diguanylate cyclase (GGDEF)-like protein